MLKLNKIYNVDCLLGMKEITNNFVDLIICDLPYGVTKNSWDKIIPLDLLWKEYERILKSNGIILLFAQGLFYVKLIQSNIKMFKYDLVWNKEIPSGFLNSNKMPLRSHEQIAVFYNKKSTYNPQMSLGPPIHSIGKNNLNKIPNNKNYGKFKLKDSSGKTDKFPKSILNFHKIHPSKVIHPTQKPLELIEYLIKTYSNENEVVLDNCMGSGTTAIAALKTNRKFIGFEINKEYFDISIDRISKLKIETPLF